MGELREDAEIETLLAQEEARLERFEELRRAIRIEINILDDAIMCGRESSAPAPTVDDLWGLLRAFRDALDEGAI